MVESVVTEHKEISQFAFEKLVKKTREITTKETEIIIEHLRYSGEHPYFLCSSNIIDNNINDFIRSHSAAILRGEITIEMITINNSSE